MSAFAHLHVASSWSMRFGTDDPASLVARAVDNGQSMLALTDRDTVAGAVSFVRACRSAGIGAILGADIALLTPQPYRPAPAKGGRLVRQERPRVTLLAHDARSWAGLCAVISKAYVRDRSEPEVDRADVMQIAGEHGLIVLLGPRSDVGYDIAHRRPDRALAQLTAWRDHDVAPYIEVATHRESADGDGLSDQLAARMLQWAIAHRTPAVLTNMVRYRDRESAPVADVLDAVRLQMTLARRRQAGRTDQAFLADDEHMAAVATRVASMVGDPRDIATRLLSHTRSLAERSVIDPVGHLGMDSVYVPEHSVLFPGDRRGADELLRVDCEQGLDRYIGDRVAGRARLEAELDVVSRMGLAGYLLTVAQVVSMVRGMGIRVAARGSGAGSFINHLLGISGVDAVRHDLLMERFVSTLRPGLPDIDIDVESARRLEVYDAVFAKFGPERTTCVSMRETYRVRQAVRDVGTALGMPPGDVHGFAKMFPHVRARYARSALAELPELRRTGLAKRAADGELDELLTLVEGLDGLPHTIAMHPCGIVLSDLSLLKRTPVQPSAQGYPMTQFDKDDVEHMGLLKLDVLGVRMQSALAYAVAEVERVEGVAVDLDQVPLDDPATFDLIRSTRTLGCFQIESPGQRELIGKFAPEEFGDLIVDISLFRPGPVKSDMITPFLRARQGWAPAAYIHDDLRAVLGQTQGVVVFHEQVMQVVSLMTGCSLEFADLVRRRLGDIGQIDEIREWFYRQCRGRYQLEVVERVWEVLRAFASFGFCKAHAAAFALPTYQSAWFKAHHPAAFLAGVLTHDPGMYPKRLIVDDARAFGVPVRGLDINTSRDTYTVESTGQGWAIRVALSEVKGISDGEVAAILAGQPYRSLADFVYRSHVSRPVVERLVLAGAFDAMHGVSRRDLLWHLAGLFEQSASAPRNQPMLDVDADEWRPAPTGLRPMTVGDQVKHEVEILGLDLSAHVVSFYTPMLRELGVVPSTRLLSTRSASRLLVAGAKVATQTPPIRSGKRVAFVTLDDSTGPVDATFFEEAQNQYAATLFNSWLLLVRGTLRRTGPRGVSVLADGCWEMGEVYRRWRDGGVAAVRDLMDAPTYDDNQIVIPSQIWEHASGFRQSPYADVR